MYKITVGDNQVHDLLALVGIGKIKDFLKEQGLMYELILQFQLKVNKLRQLPREAQRSGRAPPGTFSRQPAEVAINNYHAARKASSLPRPPRPRA